MSSGQAVVSANIGDLLVVLKVKPLTSSCLSSLVHSTTRLHQTTQRNLTNCERYPIEMQLMT